ncbi:MAG: glycosyl transferase [Pseudonocardiales bacterium]|nr:MAG: glycosyl transferase [Pseudonocardiales bacterium]
MLTEFRPTAVLTDAEIELILGSVLQDDGAWSNSTATTEARSAPSGTVACVIVGGVATAVVLLVVSSSPYPSDFLTYRYGALLAAHGTDLYDGNVTGQFLPGQPFTYPPVASIFLWPTTLGPWRASYVGWCVVSCAVLAALFAKGVPAHLGRRPVIVLAAMAGAASTGLLSANVAMGQVNLLLMGLCLADLYRRDDTALGRLVPPGVLVGIATAIKLTPTLFVVYFVVTRQRRLAWWSVVAAVSMTALGAVLRPEMSVSFFGSAIWNLTDRVDLGHPLGYPGNASISGVLHALGGPAATLATPLAVLSALLALAAARRAHRQRRELDAWLIVGLTAPLVSPFSWNHHYVYVLPALLTIVLTRPWARRPWGVALIALSLCTLLFPAAAGARLLQDGRWWTAIPGVAVRENVLLVAIGCIVALTLSSRSTDRISPPAWARV